MIAVCLGAVRRPFFMVVTPESKNAALESKLISINAFSTPEEIAEAEKKNKEIKKQFEQAKKQATERDKANKETKSNATKKKRELQTRFFSGVLYPESLPDGWLDKIKSFGWPGEISPLHNLDWQVKDFGTDGNGPAVDAPAPETYRGLLYWYKQFDKCYTDGKEDSDELKLYKEWKQKLPKDAEKWQVFDQFCQFMRDDINPKRPKEKRIKIYKKAHYHWLLITDKRMTVNALVKRLKRVLGNEATSFSLVQPVKTEIANVDAYFCHKSLDALAMHKHQYDEANKVTFNGFDIEAFKSYAPEQKRYCVKLFSYLSIVGQTMKKLTGADYLELTSLTMVQVRMASPDALKEYLEEYAKPKLELIQNQSKLKKTTAKITGKLIEISDKENKKDDKPEDLKPEDLKLKTVLGADNKKKSEKQLLMDQLSDAEQIRKEFHRQETKLALKGEEVERVLLDAEIKAVLGFIDYLLNALDDSGSWPDKALFFQSYLSYRNTYRDYMNVNNKKW